MLIKKTYTRKYHGTYVVKKKFYWLNAFFLCELEPELDSEPEPVKNIPGAGAGQKRTGSTTLVGGQPFPLSLNLRVAQIPSGRLSAVSRTPTGSSRSSWRRQWTPCPTTTGTEPSSRSRKYCWTSSLVIYSSGKVIISVGLLVARCSTIFNDLCVLVVFWFLTHLVVMAVQ